MNIDDMNMVITGAIGYLTTYSLGYFSHKVAFIVGTPLNQSIMYFHVAGEA